MPHSDGRVVLGSPPLTPNPLNAQLASPAPAPAPSATPSSTRPRSSSSTSAPHNVRRVVGEYVVEGRIGSGSFATVWRGYHKESGQLVAIKSISKEKIMVNKKHQENLDMEIAIMSQLTHDNIVRLYQVQETPRHKYLILEYCEGGDLSKFIRKHGHMSEKLAKPFLGQLASGLMFLRQANLIHRDLKPQNLLLSSDSPDAILKIADFGFARYMEPDNLAVTLCLSPDTRIAVADGSILTAAKVLVGQQLVGQDGATVKVESVHRGESAIMYEIVHADGGRYRVTPDHLVTLRWSARPYVCRYDDADGRPCNSIRYWYLGADDVPVQADFRSHQVDELAASGSSTEELSQHLFSGFYADQHDGGTTARALTLGQLFDVKAEILASSEFWRTHIATGHASGRRTALPSTGTNADEVPDQMSEKRKPSIALAAPRVDTLPRPSLSFVTADFDVLESEVAAAAAARALPNADLVDQCTLSVGATRTYSRVEAGQSVQMAIVTGHAIQDGTTARNNIDRVLDAMHVRNEQSGIILTQTSSIVKSVRQLQQLLLLRGTGVSVIVACGAAQDCWRHADELVGVSDLQSSCTSEGVEYTTFAFRDESTTTMSAVRRVVVWHAPDPSLTWAIAELERTIARAYGLIFDDAGLKYGQFGKIDLIRIDMIEQSQQPFVGIKVDGNQRFALADGTLTHNCGSPLYMAPEILGYKEYDASVDLWSVGGILFEMVTGKPPFTGSNHIQLLNRIQTTELKFPMHVELSSSLQDLLIRLLKRNPRERITFAQFFTHPYVVEAMTLAEEMVKRVHHNKNETQQQQQQQPSNPQTNTPQQQQQQQQQPQPQSLHPTNVMLQSPPLGPAATPSLTPQHQPQPSAVASPAAAAKPMQSTLSTTPPTPRGPNQPQQPQSTMRVNNSNLYGSSPSQNSFVPLHQSPPSHHHHVSAHHISPQSIIQPHRHSPGPLSTIPNNSPPNFGLNGPTYHQQQQQQMTQQYAKPTHQQVGFATNNNNTSVQQIPQQVYQQQPAQQLSSSPPSPYMQPIPHSSQQAQLQPQPQQQHSSRPISRHNTPQHLRVSGSVPEGSSGSFVLIDGDANANSQSSGNGSGATAAAGTGQYYSHQTQQHVYPPHQQPPQPSAESLQIFLDQNEVERAQMVKQFRSATVVCKAGDSRLASLASIMFGADSILHFGSPGTEVHGLLIRMIHELRLEQELNEANANPTFAAGGGGGAGGHSTHLGQSASPGTSATPTPQQQLAAVLTLYLKSMQRLHQLTSRVNQLVLPALHDRISLFYPLPVPLHIRAPSSPTSPSSPPPIDRLVKVQSDWFEVSELFERTSSEVWEKCNKVRNGLEEMEEILNGQAQGNGGNTIRLVPPMGASTTGESRRLSVSASTSLPVAPSVSLVSGSSDDSKVSPNLDDPAVLKSLPPPASRLLSVSTPCAEKLLYDDALSLAHQGADYEYRSFFEAARVTYLKSKKLFDALLLESSASEMDQRRLQQTIRMVEGQMEVCKKKMQLQQQQQQQQQSHPIQQLTVDSPLIAHAAPAAVQVN